MKLFSVIIGFILLSVSGYVVVGEYMAGVSVEAIVNARVTTLRAPIEGRLSLRSAGIGARVAPGQAIGSLVDERIDDTRLADIRYAQETARAELAKASSHQRALIEARAALAEHAASYRIGRIRQLEARIAEARSVSEGASAKLREYSNALSRARDLSERGVQTAANLDKAQSSEQVAGQELKAARERIAYLSIELDAARLGTFLGDSYNDAPFSLQKIRDLDLRIAELGTDKEELASRLRLTQERIAEEVLRLSRLTTAELAAPADGLVWEFLASNGEVVRKGQELVRLVDCTSVMITASVGEQLYNTLRPGDAAQFRLLGTAELFDTVITRLAGTGSSALYQNLAVGATPDRARLYDVTLSVPDLANSAGAACGVGRTGRVVFSGSQLGTVRRTVAELAR